jgi:hypothetical protein
MQAEAALSRGGRSLDHGDDRFGLMRDVASRPNRNIDAGLIIGDDRANVGSLAGQARTTRGFAPDFNFGRFGFQMPFDQDQLALGEEGVQSGIAVVTRRTRNEEADEVSGDDRHRVPSRFAESVRILAGNVQFMDVRGVFDGADGHTTPHELLEEVDDESCLSVVLSAHDMDAFHGLSNKPVQMVRYLLTPLSMRAFPWYNVYVARWSSLGTAGPQLGECERGGVFEWSCR